MEVVVTWVAREAQQQTAEGFAWHPAAAAAVLVVALVAMALPSAVSVFLLVGWLK